MAIHFFELFNHDAETGGDPTGFGFGSFITLVVGCSAIFFMLGRYLQALGVLKPHGTKRNRVGSTNGDEREVADNPFTN